MIRFHYIYCAYFLLIFQINSIYTYQCHICVIQVVNHPAKITDLLTPTYEDCDIVDANHACYIHIDWLADGTIEVSYGINPSVPPNSILAVISLELNLYTGVYSTLRSIRYSCQSNETTCNTLSDLKRVLTSVTLPTDQQLKQLNEFIHPTKYFNSSLCSYISNTSSCPKRNVTHCQQCISSFVQDSNHSDICLTCLTGKPTENFFDYRVTISLRTTSRSEKIRLGCQTGRNCNSMKNINRIKEILPIKFDLQKFYQSTATSLKSTATVLMMINMFIASYSLVENCSY